MFIGPHIVTDGLVLNLDAENTKSYPGTGTTWTDVSGNNNNGTLTNGPSYAFAGGNGSLTYTMVNNSSGHPTTTEGLTTFFANGTSVITGTHVGQIAWGDSNQAIRWGGNAGAYPSYHTRRTYYGWKVDGYIYLPETGNYEFLIDGDDACDFFVDGQLCSYWYGGHGFGTGAVGTTKYFTRGWYTFTARMEEQDGGDGIAVGWKKPSDSAYSTIPGSFYSTYLPTTIASSIVFDGTNDYVSANAPNFATTNSFTAMLWTKSNTSTWNATGMLLSKRTQFIIHPLAGETTVQYYVAVGTNWNAISYTHTNITSWNLYCMTYSAGSLRAYLNGDLINSGTVNSTLLSDTGQVFIGWDDGLAGRYYNGSTAMVLLYNRALTATEIQQNYNATKSRFGL